MSHDRSAAIWFARDGFDPNAKGLNGRRVAGESFLRGFLKHAQMDEIVSLSVGTSGADYVQEIATEIGCTTPVRGVLVHNLSKSVGLNAIHYPAPSIMDEVWRRQRIGQHKWSLTGITHTTASKAVMNQMLELRMVPTAPWDALICTSRSVQAHVQFQLDDVDAYIQDRFGHAPPPRFQTPVIPLGIHCDDFAPSEPAGATWRKSLGLGSDDVAFLTVCRLTPHNKFDPLPVYMALQQAAQTTKAQLHYVLCGYFPDDISREVFCDSAETLMPDVTLHVIDGKDQGIRDAALSGSDVFLFPIDNIQETFGLAPVEAMAAGLPVIASDWDGMKDTITPDVGFRVTTRLVGPDATEAEAARFQSGTDSYSKYTFQVATMTQVDVPELAERMALLADDPTLRKRMGQAGMRRAKQIYDWSAVIPQMQDLWAELAQIRTHSENVPARWPPVAPGPSRLFSGYATQGARSPATRYRLGPEGTSERLYQILTMRKFDVMGRWVAREELLQDILAQYSKHPKGATLSVVAKDLKVPLRVVDRGTMLLLKYDLVRVVG